MPECVSVPEFLQEVQEDWSSPTTSSFTSKMISCRNTVYLLEEVSMTQRVVVMTQRVVVMAAAAAATASVNWKCSLSFIICWEHEGRFQAGNTSPQ